MRTYLYPAFFVFNFLCLLLCIQLPAQSWERIYGGVNLENGSAVQQTSDGGFIVVGSTTSFGAGSWDVYVIKTDVNGDTMWTKTFGGFSTDHGYAVKQTFDGGYIIGGVTSPAVTFDIYLIKTDANGVVEWTKIINSGGTEQCNDVVQTRDSGYCIAGIKNDVGNTNTDVYLVRTDPGGDTLWTRTYGAGMNDLGYSLQQTFDDGFIVSAATYNASATYYNAFLIKTNNSGDTLWTKIYYGSHNGYGNSVAQTRDSGYILGGTSSENFYAVKTDVNGTTQWTKEIDKGGGDRCFSVIQSSDDGFVMAGYTYTTSTDADVLLIKLDSSGNELWSKKYGGSQWDEGAMVGPVVGGGYIIAGTSNSDVYLIKTECENFPAATLAVLDTLCQGDTLAATLFTNAQPGTTVQWVKDNIPVLGANLLTYSAWEDGDYTVQLTDSNGCSNESNAIRIYFPRPYFYAYPHEVCPGDVVSMEDWSAGLGFYSAYEWDFGDGTSDSGITANHVYQDTGTYFITRWARTSNGICHPYRDSVIVSYTALPPVDFDLLVNSANVYPNRACPGDRIDFIPYAYSYLFVPLPFFNPASWLWNFGDGTTDTVPYPTHYYLSYGTYTITLTVTNHCGNADSLSSTILIDSTINTNAFFTWAGPLGITNDTVNACEPIRFQTSGGVNYRWNFGDGNSWSTSSDTTIHVFAAVGSYTIQLITTNGCGNSDTLSRNLIVGGICTGIHPLTTNGNSVLIYPNPFNIHATLEINLSPGNALPFDFLVYDLQGRKVKQFSVNELPFTMDRDNLVAGMYFYKLNSDRETLATGRFIVQ